MARLIWAFGSMVFGWAQATSFDQNLKKIESFDENLPPRPIPSSALQTSLKLKATKNNIDIPLKSEKNIIEEERRKLFLSKKYCPPRPRQKTIKISTSLPFWSSRLMNPQV